jgi:hypothetical protein
VSLARTLWQCRLRPAAQRLVMISILLTFVGRAVVFPVIAEAKSYRAFMEEVNRRVQPGDKLYVIGGFNTDPVIFYRGGVIDEINDLPVASADKLGTDKVYVIMARQSWNKFQRQNRPLPPPILESAGAGPEGDAPLVLVQMS